MNSTANSFAFRLFQAIRANKKALVAEVPLYRPNSKNHVQNEAMRGLLDAMFAFEKFCRGAQPALADKRNDAYFTLGVKKQEASVDLHNCHLDFVIKASNLANQVQKHLVNCLELLRAPVWQVFLSMEGNHASGFRDVVRDILRNDQLPQLAGRFPGVSAEFSDSSHLKMEFKAGPSVKTADEFFFVHVHEGKTVKEQIVRIAAMCGNITQFAIKAACDRSSWPMQTRWPTAEDAHNAEVGDVNHLLSQFYKSLPWHRQELLRRHPDAAKAFFSNPM
jgi:hypothetical protein